MSSRFRNVGTVYDSPILFLPSFNFSGLLGYLVIETHRLMMIGKMLTISASVLHNFNNFTFQIHVSVSRSRFRTFSTIPYFVMTKVQARPTKEHIRLFLFVNE